MSAFTNIPHTTPLVPSYNIPNEHYQHSAYSTHSYPTPPNSHSATLPPMLTTPRNNRNPTIQSAYPYPYPYNTYPPYSTPQTPAYRVPRLSNMAGFRQHHDNLVYTPPATAGLATRQYPPNTIPPSEMRSWCKDSGSSRCESHYSSPAASDEGDIKLSQHTQEPEHDDEEPRKMVSYTNDADAKLGPTVRIDHITCFSALIE